MAVPATAIKKVPKAPDMMSKIKVIPQRTERAQKWEIS
jgi:hypothetical protein